MFVMKRGAIAAVWTFVILAASGCSKPPLEVVPELAPVNGIVTLDGKPLVGGSVQFTAKEGTSVATTDANGKYVLKYRNKIEGGPVGANVVRIAKYDEVKGADGNVLAGPSLIPSRYNDNTTLSADVKAKSPNEYNFDLKSR